MVYLTPRFSFLASVLALGVLSLPLPADGIALPRTHNGNVALPRYVVLEPRHSDKKNDDDYDDQDDKKKTSSKGGKGGSNSKPQRSSSPQLGLPSRANKKSKGGKAKGGKHGSAAKHGGGAKHGGDKHGKSRHEQRMIYDPSDPLIRIGPLDVVGHDYSDNDRAHVKLLDIREQDEGVQGTVDITSTDAESSQGHRIASMWLDTTSSNGTFTLTASDVNQTQLYMVSIANEQYNKTSSESDPDDRRVKLQLPVFNSTAAAMTLYCVFFNPSPPQPEPMTMEPCLIDGAVPPPDKSEMFAYNARTGVIRPMWFQGKNDGKRDAFSTASYDDEYYEPLGNGYGEVDSTEPEADVASVTSANSTTPSNSTTSSNSTTAAPPAYTSSSNAWNSWSNNNNSVVARGPLQVQNVTLVFTPSAPQVVKVEAFSSSVSLSSSAAPVSTSIVTATTTTTTSETATTTMTLVQISASASSSVSSAEATTTAAAQVSIQNLAVSASESTVPTSTTSIIESTSTSSSSSTESVVSVMEASPSTVTAYSTYYATATPSSSSVEALDADAVASSIAAGSSSAEPTPTADAVNAFAASSPDSSSSAASASMTPVTTAPYTWMFTPDSRL